MRGSRPLSGFEASDFERDERLLPGHLFGDVDKTSSVPNPFQIQHNDVRVLVRGYHRQHVRLVDVCLVAQADQAREAEAVLPRPVDDGGAEGPGMRDEADMTLGGHGRGQEGGVERQVRVQAADAVGPHHADAMLTGDLQTSGLEGSAFRPGFAEPGCDHDGRTDAALTASLQYLRRGRRGYDQDGQVDRVGHLGQVSVQRTVEQIAGFLAYKMDRALVAAVDQVTGCAVTQLFGRGGGADDDDTARVKERGEGG